MTRSSFCLPVALALTLAAVAPAAARQHCIVTGNGTVVCPYATAPYYDPARRPGYRAETANPYRYGTPSRPYNQPVH